jgi:class 3 adenylate cyclase/pimeloyl-ACP methyl ester carboxylesterase
VTEASGIRYATTTDGCHIAYKAWGQGKLVHVFLPEFGACVDSLGQHPAHIRFERFIGSLSRCICFDPRGIGASDPVPLERIGALGDWVTDLASVLDNIGVERIVFTGEGYSAQAAILFAVMYPDRVVRLTLSNAYARMTTSDDYPIGSYSTEEVAPIVEAVGRDWGTGSVLMQFAPTLTSDPSFLEVCARIERLVCSPSTAQAMIRAIARSDVRDLLPRVSCPTLIYYTGDLVHVSADQSRYLAEHIPGANFIEAQGRSFYQPDEAGQLDAWAEFIVGGRPKTIDRRLATILFVDVVGSTEHASTIGDHRWAATLEDLDAWVGREVEKHGGRLVKQTGDGHLATFDAPSEAVKAACAIAHGVHVLGVEIRCGLHVGEIELRPGGDVGGIAVNTAARVLDVGGPRQVIVSRTVADLAAGSGFCFEDKGSHELKGITGALHLYEVKN